MRPREEEKWSWVSFRAPCNDCIMLPFSLVCVQICCAPNWSQQPELPRISDSWRTPPDKGMHVVIGFTVPFTINTDYFPPLMASACSNSRAPPQFYHFPDNYELQSRLLSYLHLTQITFLAWELWEAYQTDIAMIVFALILANLVNCRQVQWSLPFTSGRTLSGGIWKREHPNNLNKYTLCYIG